MELFIEGQNVPPHAGTYYTVVNPASEEPVERVALAAAEDVRRAIDAAHTAFPQWAGTPGATRAQVLLRAAEAIRAKDDELARLLTTEQGKPLREAVREIRGFVRTLEYYAGFGPRLSGEHVPLSETHKEGLVLQVPAGVCAAITPWNYPVTLTGWKVAPALIAGNTLVVKPASNTPLAVTRCLELLVQAGLPRGAVNVVTGPGSIVGRALVEHPAVRHIGFTGETATGRSILQAAGKHITRVTLELGGSDPMIVCEDADLEVAVDAALWARFRNAGQSCTAVKRLYLLRHIAGGFIAKLLERTRGIHLGDGLAAETTMGPLNNQGQRGTVERLVEDAVSRGAHLLTGGRRPPHLPRGYFYEPTLLTDIDRNAAILREECFGPALPIVVVDSLDEAIEQANDSVYGLGSSIWTHDLAKAQRAARRLEAGMTWINCHQESNVEVPFGGVKESGVGRELGYAGLAEYLESKTIVVNYQPTPKF